MPFVIRPYRRFPVVCSVTYEHWFQEGEGFVWNLSATGWRMSGNLLLQPKDICSVNLTLPTKKPLFITAGIVRWVSGQDYGIETLVMEGKAQTRLGEYICEQMQSL